MPAETFDYLNLNDVDTSRKAIEPNVYTLEVNKLDFVKRTISKVDSPYAGQEVPVIKASFTIVDDEQFSGRKLWNDFWVVYEGFRKDLKYLMNASGVIQADGQSLEDWASQFATLNPPARFQAPVTKEQDRRDPTGDPVNKITFRQSKPAA